MLSKVCTHSCSRPWQVGDTVRRLVTLAFRRRIRILLLTYLLAYCVTVLGKLLTQYSASETTTTQCYINILLSASGCYRREGIVFGSVRAWVCIGQSVSRAVRPSFRVVRFASGKDRNVPRRSLYHPAAFCRLKGPWWCWLCGSAVERWSLTGEISLSCARPTADGWPLMWVNRPL